MAVWFELVAMMLAAYGFGLGLGWVVWGRSDTIDTQGDSE